MFLAQPPQGSAEKAAAQSKVLFDGAVGPTTWARCCAVWTARIRATGTELTGAVHPAGMLKYPLRKWYVGECVY